MVQKSGGMMWTIKNVLFASALALCFSAPAISSAQEPAYQVTETQLGELDTVFQQLKTKQSEQDQTLKTQRQQIETLQNQLDTSQKAMNSSQQEMQKLETSLNEANQYLQQSAEEEKQTEKRLKRQRTVWAVVASVTLGIAIAKH